MQEFIEYFDKLSEIHDLVLKIEKSKYRNWEVYIYRKGYDMPIIESINIDKEKAFKVAHGMLNNWLFEGE